MPTFSTARPQGIAQSFASLMAGNPGVNAKDMLDADVKIASGRAHEASAAHSNSLTAKVMEEVNAMREAERLRSDPGMATEYGARASGMQLPDANAVEDNFRGRQVELAGPPNVNAGETSMPTATTPMPTSVTPQQVQQYQSSLASLMANRLATGKTNANQLTQAGGNILSDAFRARLSTPNLSPAERTSNLEALSEKPVTPFRQNSAGSSVVNEMDGTTQTPNTITATIANALTKSRAGAENALAGQRSSAARVNDARVPLLNAQTERTKNPAPKTFKPVDPMQAEKRLSDMTQKEYDSLPRNQRYSKSNPTGITLEQYRNKRRKEIQSTGVDMTSEINDANEAIANGADPAAVKARFRQRTKADLPEVDSED